MARTVEQCLLQAIASLTLQNAQLIVQLEAAQSQRAALEGELAEARGLRANERQTTEEKRP